MRAISSAVLLSLQFIMWSGASQAETPLLTPSELNAHVDQYDGQMVRVRGWFVFQFEDIGLWDTAHAHDAPHEGGDRAVSLKVSRASFTWPASCVSVTGVVIDQLKRNDSYPAIIEGTFRKHILPPDVVSNGVCNDTGLEVAKIDRQNP
jgi:hypothetical protein